MSNDGDRAADARRAYAASLSHGAAALERAFASVAREDFLPAPPWTIYDAVGEQTVRDPAHLYADVLVAIDRAKGINNGQPSLHAEWIRAVDPQPGETIVHVGCGGGYYTAILAELVGEAGRVIAYEIEPEVAALARRSLSSRPNVEVRDVSGAAGDLPACDVIYVNAAAEAPAREWIAALRDGGRLIFPWRHSNDGETAMLVRRAGDVYAAASLTWVKFIGLTGARPQKARRMESRLSVDRIRELVLRDRRLPDQTCAADFGWGWFSAP
ncbi:MAG: protein-L-isoaspartate O-methyltransferase family protein [Beijerinckiaceae bacterium]